MNEETCGSMPSDSERDSAQEAHTMLELGRRFGKRPVFYSWLLWYHAVAIGLLFGLPRDWAWGCLFAFLVMLMVAQIVSELKDGLVGAFNKVSAADASYPFLFRVFAVWPFKSLLVVWISIGVITFVSFPGEEWGPWTLVSGFGLAFVAWCLSNLAEVIREKDWNRLTMGAVLLAGACAPLLPNDDSEPIPPGGGASVSAPSGLDRLFRPTEYAEYQKRIREGSNRPQLPARSPDSPEDGKNTRHHTARLEPQGKQTQDYWKVAVADFHELRFIDPEGDGDSKEFFNRQMQELRKRIKTAKSAIPLLIDPALFEMANRHMKDEERLIALFAESKEFAASSNRNQGSRSVDQVMTTINDFFNVIEAEDPTIEELAARMNAPVHLVEGMFEMLEIRHNQLIEIKEMQESLRSRYQGFDFALPDVGLVEEPDIAD